MFVLYENKSIKKMLPIIWKRETMSYIQYAYDVDFMYRKGKTCIIPTICLCSRFCVHERGKLCHTYSMFMIYILCIRKRGTVSYLHCVYVVDFVYPRGGTVSYLQYVYVLYVVLQKEGNCVMHTLCLWYRCCVSERGKLYHTYNMFMF
jgi:hypothetical protein